MLRASLAALLVLAPVSVSAQPATAEGSEASLATSSEARPLEAVRLVWRDHPSLRAGENLRVDFQVKFHWDARRPGDHPFDFDTYEIRRARVGIEGEIFRHIQFSLERELTEREIDLSKPSKSVWKDVWLEANYTDAAQVRVGKFKIPFGLEQLTGISNLDFVYRTLGANYLAPGRDVGVMVHGRFFDRGLNYWGGVFRQDGENARSPNIAGADETVAARVTGTPFRAFKAAGLDRAEVGGAFTVSSLPDPSVLPNGLRGRTIMSRYDLFDPVFVRGRRQRFEADVDWSTGPVGLRAEYTHVLDTREGQGLANEDLPDARARAWYVSGAWVVTGEEKERPVEPRRKLGAVEIVARYERFWFDSAGGEQPPQRNPRAETILPNGEKVVTLGVNWYPNRWVKLLLQALREQPFDLERSPVLDNAEFWSGVVRIQLAI